MEGSLVFKKKNLTILVLLGNSFSPSWNLNFYRNLIAMEIENLERFMSSLSSVHLSPFAAYSRAWSLSSSSSFSVKKSFLRLVGVIIQSHSLQPNFY